MLKAVCHYVCHSPVLPLRPSDDAVCRKLYLEDLREIQLARMACFPLWLDVMSYRPIYASLPHTWDFCHPFRLEPDKQVWAFAYFDLKLSVQLVNYCRFWTSVLGVCPQRLQDMDSRRYGSLFCRLVHDVSTFLYQFLYDRDWLVVKRVECDIGFHHILAKVKMPVQTDGHSMHHNKEHKSRWLYSCQVLGHCKAVCRIVAVWVGLGQRSCDVPS